MIPELKIARSNGILTITLMRSERKNALTNEMYKVLADTIEQASSDKDLRVMVIQADGDTFSAGNDVAEFADQEAGRGPNELHVSRFLENIASTNIPIVASVQGMAVGVGTTMLLHCDYVLLADDAQLITPFINLGLVPEAASALLLPLRIGHARAFEMFALGQPISAQLALTWGLANNVVPAAELHRSASDIAKLISTKPPGSLTATKQLMRETSKIVDQMRAEATVFFERLQGPEAKEAFSAFMEKRAPDFSRPRE